MAISLAEVGRNLRVTVGDEITFDFTPASAQDGVTLALHLFAMHANYAAADLGIDPAKAGETLVQLTLGEHQDEVMQLRWEEVQQIQNAVQYWQAAGGSFAIAKLSVDDPKAATQQWAFAASLALNVSYSSGAQPATSEGAGTTRES